MRLCAVFCIFVVLIIAGCGGGATGNSNTSPPNGPSSGNPGTGTPGTTTGDQFVSTSGNNTWTGTAATYQGGNVGPVATVAQAQANVRSQVGTKSLTIVIEGGTYYGTSLSFSASDSGSSTSPVIYENYSGQLPVLSGGMRVTTWTQSSSGLCAGQSVPCYVSTLSEGTAYFEALYYNGIRRLRPRMGASANNLLGSNGRVFASSSSSSFEYTASDPVSSSWSNLTVANPGNGASNDIELYDFQKWSVSVERIASVASAGCSSGSQANCLITLTGSTGTSSQPAYTAGHRYVIENVRDLFHYAGQWFLDRSVSPWNLYYLANPGENPNSDIVEVPQSAQVLAATNLSWVTFSGIQFEHDNYTVPQTGYSSTQLEPNLPSMVHCAGCQNVVFDHDIFAHTTGSAVDLTSNGSVPSSSSAVQYSSVFDIGGHGIKIGQAPGNSDSDASVTQLVRVTQNGITGVGRVFGGSDGIALGDVHDVEVSYNDISDSYHGGMEVCKPSGNKCQGGAGSHGTFNINVHDNRVSQIMQGVTNDGGCIYAMTSLAVGTATGNQITHNWCDTVSDASTQDSDGYGGHGIYLDNGTGGWMVQNNFVLRVSATAYNLTWGPQQNGTPNSFNNNIAAYARSSVVGVSRCPIATPLLQFNFTNNIVYQDRTESQGTRIQKGGAQYLGTRPPTLMQNWNNNTYWNTAENWSSTTSMFTSQTSSNCTGQAQYSFAAWQTFGEDVGSQVQNPGFRNPTYPADDYSFTGPPPAHFVPFTLQFGRSNPTPLPPVPASMPIMPYLPTDF